MEVVNSYWPIGLGIAVLIYAGWLIHSRIEIGVGQAILAIAGLVMVALPFVNVTVGQDGSVMLSLKDVNIATQEALKGVNALQSRLDGLAKETESRLSALEASSRPPGTQPTSSTNSLPKIAKPSGQFVRAIDDNAKLIESLQNSLPGGPWRQ